MSDAKPSAFLRTLAALGPGIVVAGSVIGSGELINTPKQAALFGFVLLWTMLLSCVIKYFLQVELARHCLARNCSTVQALNEVPGPKLFGTSWIVILYMFGYCAAMLTILGIIGALGGLMHSIYPLATSPETSTRIWGALNVLLAIALLWQGWYRQLEVLVMILVGGFSISAAVGVFLIQRSQYHISTDQVLSGLTFSLGDNRAEAAFAVISLMGALGVAANELLMYPYWILEKGYARELGDPASEGWVERARRSIRIVWLDAGLSTLLATMVTAAFFLLGAAVLHGDNIVPEGLAVVDQVSRVFTQSYGPWSKSLYLVGAFCTLFSTLVVVSAATGRMGADLFGSLGLIDYGNKEWVHRCHQLIQTVWLVALLVAFLMLKATPDWSIISGHFVLGAFLTPLLMFSICYLAFRTDKRVRMRWPAATALVGSVAIIFGVVAYAGIQILMDSK